MLATTVLMITAFEALFLAALIVYAIRITVRIAEIIDRIDATVAELEVAIASVHPDLYVRRSVAAHSPPDSQPVAASSPDRHPLLEEYEDEPHTGDATDRFLGPRLRL